MQCGFSHTPVSSGYLLGSVPRSTVIGSKQVSTVSKAVSGAGRRTPGRGQRVLCLKALGLLLLLTMGHVVLGKRPSLSKPPLPPP